VVRDNKTIETVRRILDRREQAETKAAAAAVAQTGSPTINKDNIEDNDDEEEEEEDEDLLAMDTTDKDDIDSFRAKLAAEWNLEDEPTRNTETQERRTSEYSQSNSVQKSTATKTTTSKQKYRLCSMLGEAVGIRSGPDMQKDVIESVKANALPREEEDTMIILSAASPPELVAIRALVAQYESSKKIVLVNCRTQPLPRELSKAQTVYSVLPLVGKPVAESKRNGPPARSKTMTTSPRIVVLRRFPRDWEIFVDTGTGFELAVTAPVASAQPKGPPMSWIVQKVQFYLSTKAT
jgi:hypothetical protein